MGRGGEGGWPASSSLCDSSSGPLNSAADLSVISLSDCLGSVCLSLCRSSTGKLVLVPVLLAALMSSRALLLAVVDSCSVFLPHSHVIPVLIRL